MKREDFKIYIAVAVLISGIIASLYVGAWLMFIKPIIAACAAYDAGTLTGYIIGNTILKCVFSGVAGGIVFFYCIYYRNGYRRINIKRINSIKRRKKYRSIGVIDMR